MRTTAPRNPSAGTPWGVFAVLGETLRPGNDGWALLVAAAAMVVATAALARSAAEAEPVAEVRVSG